MAAQNKNRKIHHLVENAIALITNYFLHKQGVYNKHKEK